MADTLVPQGIAQKSRFFREISGNNEAGPLESSCTAASRTMCCLQMHPLTLTTAAAVACGPAGSALRRVQLRNQVVSRGLGEAPLPSQRRQSVERGA